MTGYFIGLIGMWLFTDGLYSITLYINAPSYDGKPRQTWRQDHWVRAVRMVWGMALIVLGAMV
jgi:negative regulator of sigma E activity